MILVQLLLLHWLLYLHHVPSIISTPIWKSLWLYICQKDLCRSFLLTIWYCCTHTSVCGKYILVFYANLFCCSSQQVEMCSFCLLIRVKLKIGISHKRGRGSSLNLSKNSLLDSPWVIDQWNSSFQKIIDMFSHMNLPALIAMGEQLSTQTA